MQFCAIQAVVVFALVTGVTFSEREKQTGKPDSPLVIDFAPLNGTTDVVDCKIEFFSKTNKGDSFSTTIRTTGAGARRAEDVLYALKFRYEGLKWRIREISKTELLVYGDAENPIEEIAIGVTGLEKQFHPVVKPAKKK